MMDSGATTRKTQFTENNQDLPLDAPSISLSNENNNSEAQTALTNTLKQIKKSEEERVKKLH